MLKIHFTEKEKIDLFEKLGFAVEPMQFGQWDQRSHGLEEWVENERPAVIVQIMGESKKAVEIDSAFNALINARLKELLLKDVKHIDARLALVEYSLNNNLKAVNYG